MSESFEERKLLELLNGIQLDHFYGKITNKLHVTRIDHIEHVREADLLSLDMTMPEIRRLFDSTKRFKRRNFFSKLRKSFRISGSSENVHYRSSMSLIEGGQVTDVKHGLKCLINEQDIVLEDMLGVGAFGYVQSAEWIKNPKEKLQVAVKCLQENDESRLSFIQNELMIEANAMSSLNHPNLIRLFGIVLSTPMMLVTELAPLGALVKRLQQEPEKFLISTLCSFVVQIAAGMKYLEAHRFVHRDLAARNILLMSYEKIKIGDFGLARPLPKNKEYYVMQSDGLVPYAWCAPECLKYRKFSHASDVWAFGITVLELFSYGAEPWIGLNGEQILNKIDEPSFERPPCPDHCPSAIYSILKDFCWNHEPEYRAQFSMLEKYLLKVLPREVKGSSDRYTINHEDLSYKRGDIITIFDASDERVWRGQNRTNLQVGYIPADFVDFCRSIISDPFDQSFKSNHFGDSGKKYEVIDNFNQNILSENERKIYEDKLSSGYGSYGNKSMQQIKRDSEVFSTCSGYSSPGGTSRGGRSGCSSRFSYCEECLSQYSYDSGCGCRCSTISSDSSQRFSDCSMPSLGTNENAYLPINIPGDNNESASQPISIPGGSHSLMNHKHKICGGTSMYQVFPYDNHKGTSSMPTSSSFPSDNPLRASTPSDATDSPNIYDTVKSLSLDHKQSTDSPPLLPEVRRSTLPNVVNPKKFTAILQRRKSLPRMKTKHAKNYENKLFKSQELGKIQTSLSISSPHSIENSVSPPQQQQQLYDIVPSICLSKKQIDVIEPPTIYENMNDLHTKNHGMIKSRSASDSNVFVDVEKQNEKDTPCTPCIPPRHKRKQKRTRDSDGKYEVKQCVILGGKKKESALI